MLGVRAKPQRCQITSSWLGQVLHCQILVVPDVSQPIPGQHWITGSCLCWVSESQPPAVPDVEGQIAAVLDPAGARCQDSQSPSGARSPDPVHARYGRANPRQCWIPGSQWCQLAVPAGARSLDPVHVGYYRARPRWCWILRYHPCQTPALPDPWIPDSKSPGSARSTDPSGARCQLEIGRAHV